MSRSIEAGARVRVRTTNGGEVEGVLAHRYVPTYAVDLEHLPAMISAERVAAVEPIIESFDELVASVPKVETIWEGRVEPVPWSTEDFIMAGMGLMTADEARARARAREER